MDGPESLAFGEEPLPPDNFFGKFVFQGGCVLVYGLPDQAPEHTLVKTGTEGIYGENTGEVPALSPDKGRVLAVRGGQSLRGKTRIFPIPEGFYLKGCGL
jgi:hypothetical protein